jgi:hypothetical protein
MAAKNLLQTLISVKTNLQTVSNDHIIELFEETKCREIDERCENIPEKFILLKRNKCIQNLSRCKIDHTDHFCAAFNAYNEIVIYDLLKQKCDISSIIESRQESRPDFIHTNTCTSKVNLELKTLQFNGGIYNYRDIQQQHTRSKIELEKANKNEPYNSNSLRIITSPFKRKDKMTPITRKNVIESLIDKVQNSYDINQLTHSGNPGVLLIDTVVYGFPYFLQEALPYYLLPPLNTVISGCLWHCCFGKKDERTFDWIPGHGEKNIGPPLEKDGVLMKEGSLTAVIFIIHVSGQTKFVGFHKSNSVHPAIMETLGQICDFINDEFNAHPFKPLSLTPLTNY